MKILTVTLCPAFDIHCHAAEFEARRENLAHITDCDAGGKGVNISRALTVCGVSSTALVVVGDENGDGFCRALENDGINYTAIKVKGRIRENITVHTDNSPETRLSFDGFDVPDDLLKNVDAIVKKELSAGDIMTFCGRMPRRMDMGKIKEFLKSTASRGIKLVIDSGSFTLADLCDVKPYLIKPNEQEIAAFIGREIGDDRDVCACARKIMECGIENVMISLGSRGAVLCNSDGEFFVAAPHIDAISTIGAGDSSIAGFLAALKGGKSGRDLIKSAVAYGSAACLTSGTRPPRREDVERFIKELK